MRELLGEFIGRSYFFEKKMLAGSCGNGFAQSRSGIGTDVGGVVGGKERLLLCWGWR